MTNLVECDPITLDNFNFRTKRKRDNSQGARSESPGNEGLPHVTQGPTCGDSNMQLPPWCDPDYPYSRGLIG